MRLVSLIALLVALAACSEAPQQTIPTYQVAERDFRIQIPAIGELEAAEATNISSPGRRPMVISWLAEENQTVKKGQVVARFDAEQLLLDKREEQLEMMMLDSDMRKKNAEHSKDQNSLNSDEVLIGKEFNFVDAFAIDDLRLYSKLEIIDTLSNKEYLGAKDNFIDWKLNSLDEQNQSALDVLEIRKQGHEAKFKQHEQALSKLEVKAPYDGLLVYDKNWRGDKASVGQTVFPGATIAKIPNLSHMQAKVYVLDKDAIGLANGQPVEVTLEAFPDQHFNGEVKSVSGFSRTIKRGNPTKYFEVIVDLPVKAEQMQPGQKVTANINVKKAEPALIVPLQALFNQQGNNFVYVKQGQDFVKQPVSTGQKNLYFVEIVEGLSPGDNIALSEPSVQETSAGGQL
ncbi:efflux RND transporter periplasmic adaptor subunit [Neptunicella marina]|uniref:Efflux RND transporter periplasmic adaptor subunit n=1 Tax=Neptunicella marina TaxID=2125989 RepID=A0A8J6M6V6_9ALTE|nr:efflux RND transporter periplasmic adaptor subunit [Neptunicella marina]MBC3767376.1 efflux RND transporter periplasmic adaptor subunit [Neptunicella marina]